MNKNIKISEIFGPTIQGEGALIGQPTVFVRTGGCDYRCTWCDTLHAVDSTYRHDWKPMNAKEIMNEITCLSEGQPTMVTLSGGNPAIQPLGPLINLGHKQGYRFAMETQGTIAQNWFTDLDVLTLSPKPPSSGHGTNWDKFDECLKAACNKPQIALKIVVFDEIDYTYAQDAAARYPDLPLYLQPGNHKTEGPADLPALNARLEWLANKVTNDNTNAHVLPQLHVMLWGNKRGV
ncbi:MAG: 7-carboxy-7-deazaguanine synthase QueE [Alphaproteobacteria bacterium]|nr:7-carboxy-7-deazaguanine synthase QueE [Alphaproteobacteria bacterium]